MILTGVLASHAATITIVNGDSPGEGFNDPTAVAPVGDNPGVTIGQQRLNVFQEAAILYAPSKAANAGGVAVSGLEMSQNSSRISWDEEELEKLLKNTMLTIHDSCVEYGKKEGRVDYLAGANIAGFIKVADAMLSFGHT